MRERQTPLKTKAVLVYPISRKDPPYPAGWQGPQSYQAESCGHIERGRGPPAQAVPFLPQQGVVRALVPSLLPALGCFVTRRHGDAGPFCDAHA